MWIENSLKYKLNFEGAEELETKSLTPRWIMEKAREFQKNIYFCVIDYAKTFDCVDHSNYGKFLRNGSA